MGETKAEAKMIDKESGNVFGASLAALVVYFVMLIVMMLWAPLRNYLPSLVEYYGNCVNCPEPMMIVNVIEYGFIPLVCGIVAFLVIVAATRREEDKYAAD
jgi:mannitol-specific phosphotransferase system IIBC component